MQHIVSISFKAGNSKNGIPLDWDRFPVVYLVNHIVVKEGCDYFEVMSNQYKNYMILYEFGDFLLDDVVIDSKSVRYM